jgi:Protein of unknown function (DUF2975).
MIQSYNEKRFNIVLSITRVASIIINILLWIGLGVSVIGVIALAVIQPEQLIVRFADLPNIPFQLEWLSVSWEELIGEESIALQLPLLFFGGAVVVMSAIGLLMIRQVRGILQDVKQKRPFSDANARRIFRIAYAMVAYSVLSPLSFGLVTWSIIRQFEFASRDGFRVNVSFSMLFVAALIYLLAHVFSYGAHLQEEVDGTI